MDKTYCDVCGRDITDEAETYSVSIYDNLHEGTSIEGDLCKSCERRVRKSVKDFFAEQKRAS